MHARPLSLTPIYDLCDHVAALWRHKEGGVPRKPKGRLKSRKKNKPDGTKNQEIADDQRVAMFEDYVG